MNITRYIIALLTTFLLVLGGCAQPLPTDMDTASGKVSGADLTDYNALFSSDHIHSFTVEISRSEWDKLNKDMKDYKTNFNSYRTGGYYPANLIYNGINGTKILDQVGFRTRGNTTRAVPEPTPGNFTRSHFALKFNETFGLNPLSLAYNLRNDRRLFNLRGLNLKYAGDSIAVVRELFAYTYLNQQGIIAPKAGLAKLEIRILEPSGTPKVINYGYYTAVEPVNKSFLTRRWGSDNDGLLYKCLWQSGGPATLEWNSSQLKNGTNLLGVEDWTTNYRPSYDLTTAETGTVADHSVLVGFIQNLNTLSGAALKTYLDANFDMDNYLKWMAANLLLGMPDDYRSMGNNYHLYFPGQGKKGVFIPYDYDNGLGNGWLPYNTASVGIFDVPTSPDFTFPFGSSRSRPLVDKVLAIPEYRAAYVAALEAQLNSGFNYDAYQDFYLKVKDLVGDFDYLGPDGNSPMMATDTQSSYFATRIQRVRDDIALFQGEVSQVSLSLNRGPEFTQLSSGVWKMPYSTASTQDFSLGVDITGEGVAKVNFEDTSPGAIDPLNVFAPLTNSDSSPPFATTFSVPFHRGFLSLKITAYDSSNALLGTKIYSDLGTPYWDDYISILNNNDGTYLFRFKPSHFAYGANTVEGVYLRGALTENNGDWNTPIPMTDKGGGVYEVVADAQANQQYKFFVDNGNPSFPGTSWAGDWYTDWHNPLFVADTDQNSIVP